jgi:hypothetical protein
MASPDSGVVSFLASGFLISIVLALSWIFIPFAIFGANRRLNRLLTALSDLVGWQKILSEDLGRIEAELKHIAGTQNAAEYQSQGVAQVHDLPKTPQTEIPVSLKEQAKQIREKSQQHS